MNLQNLKQNELFILKLMKLSNSWLWTDEGEFYTFQNGKVIPSIGFPHKLTPSFVGIFLL